MLDGTEAEGATTNVKTLVYQNGICIFETWQPMVSYADNFSDGRLVIIFASDNSSEKTTIRGFGLSVTIIG